MLLFAFLIAVFLLTASVRGNYYLQTVIDESAIYDSTKGSNFQGGWVDSLGIAYFVKPSTRAVQILTPVGNTSLIVGPSSSSSSSGANGPASTVQLDGVYSIYGDTSGNLYISSGQYFIWKYDHSSGIVSRFAGATPASQSYSGDGGQATAAGLASPNGLFLSSNGILYFADTAVLRVRKIDTATGIIKTFAGSGNPFPFGDSGPATSACLNYPISVWGNSNGIIFIADSGNYRIRQVDTLGIITTFAGNGNSGYNGDNMPATSASINLNSVTGDSNGNIFFADSNNNYRVRMIKDGNISTLAGNGYLGSVSSTLIPANTSIPPPRTVIVDPVTGAIYFTAVASANMLVTALPTAIPTSAPTNIPTSLPTQTPTVTPTPAPSFHPTETPTITPTPAPSFHQTETPTIPPTNPSKVPSTIPSFRPSTSPTNNNINNNSTLNSDSRSHERMSDLHIFYATFFPAFSVLLCLLLAALVYVFCYRNNTNSNEEKDKNEKKDYEKVGVVEAEASEGVVVNERYYKMWF